jgi:hypothetical protein
VITEASIVIKPEQFVALERTPLVTVYVPVDPQTKVAAWLGVANRIELAAIESTLRIRSDFFIIKSPR